MGLSSLSKRLTVPAHGNGVSSPWINDDIRPLPPSRRTWNKYAFINFWAINQICLSNWQVGSSLVAVGLSVWQAMIATIIAKCFISCIAIFNGYVGAEYHIGFPIFSRAIWGVYGAYLALVQRILLGLVWFAVQSWTGGLCVTAILGAIFPTFHNMANTLPTSANMTTAQFTGWIVYNLITIPLLYIPPEKTKRLLAVSNSISFITLLGITIWALSAADGAGPLLSQPAEVARGGKLGWAIVQGVTTVIGNVAVGLTNQADYCRFARRPGDQIFGQYFSILLLGSIMPLLGCLVSSATLKIYGEAIWNPPNVVLRWMTDKYDVKVRAAGFFAGVGLVVCQLAINTIDNSFSTGMDLSALFPKYINIRRGAYIGLVISIAMCPWELLASAGTFIEVMSAYSVFLGPMCGIQICDYWVLRQRRLKLSDLYDPYPQGIYYFTRGLNWRAFVAWVVGWAPQVPGFINAINTSIVVPADSQKLYYLAFPLGFLISFLVFWALNKLSPPVGWGLIDEVDHFNTFTPDEAAKMGCLPTQDIEGVEVLGDEKAVGMRIKPELL